MSDDEILEALGAAAREDDPLRDPRLDALVRGKATPGEKEALAEKARSSEAYREALEGMEPLGAAARERIAARLIETLKRPAAEAPAPVVETPKAPVALQPKPKKRSPVLAVVFALAAALGMALLFARPGVTPMPAYALEVAGGDKVNRSTGEVVGGVLHLAPGSRLELTLRPARAAEGPVAAWAFLRGADGKVQPWSAPVTVAEGGAVRVAGSREALFAGIAPGRWQAIVAVGRPGSPPTSLEIEAVMLGRRTGREPFRALDQTVELVDAP